MPESRILLGVIGRAHGVRGLVRVTSHTADPAALAAYGPLTDAKGRRFTLLWRGEGIAEVSEIIGDRTERVSDRTAAERLTNVALYINRVQLPPPEEDEFYLADLIGLAAFTPDGAALGRVAVVHDYGAGTSIEIERDDAPALIVPFTRACVPEVDVAGARVVVVVPAASAGEEITNSTAGGSRLPVSWPAHGSGLRPARGQAPANHPRLCCAQQEKTWIAGPSPAIPQSVAVPICCVQQEKTWVAGPGPAMTQSVAAPTVDALRAFCADGVSR
jgi:16S rRNA processing protein RimM